MAEIKHDRQADVPLERFDEQLDIFQRYLEEAGLLKSFANDSSDSADFVPELPGASCPGISYEFEMRPGHERRFARLASILGPMLHHLHKVNTNVIASQLISSQPLVWIERYANCKAMELSLIHI